MAVTCHESTLRLNYNEFLILIHLVENDNSIVSKERLMSIGWPDSVVTESSLHKAIFNLRSTLNLSESVKIKTIPGKGYILICKNSVRRDEALSEQKNTEIGHSENGHTTFPNILSPISKATSAVAAGPTGIFRLAIVIASIMLLAISINIITNVFITNKVISDQKIELVTVNNIQILKYKDQKVPEDLLQILKNKKNISLFYNHYDRTSHIVIFDSETLNATNYYVKDINLDSFIDNLSFKK
nr:winged helix-turn-helix domain-containing protein [Vibrio hepatarius]